MKALIGNLPVQDDHVDRKGKAVDIPNRVGNEDDNDWGEDKLLLTATHIRMSRINSMLSM